MIAMFVLFFYRYFCVSSLCSRKKGVSRAHFEQFTKRNIEGFSYLDLLKRGKELGLPR